MTIKNNRKFKPLALNNQGFTHHVLLLVILVVFVTVSIGVFGLIKSGAEAVKTNQYAIPVSSQLGCSLAGRKYDSQKDVCKRECQYPNATGVTYKQPGANAITGYCSSYVNPDASAEQKANCLNNLHRYFINYIGCAKKRGQDTNAANYRGCQPEFPNYVASGATDYCTAQPLSKVAASQPAQTVKQPVSSTPSSVKAQPSIAKTITTPTAATQPVTVKKALPATIEAAEATQLAAKPAAADTSNSDTCPTGQTVATVANQSGEQSKRCLPTSQFKNCGNNEVLSQSSNGSTSCQSSYSAKGGNYMPVDNSIRQSTCTSLGRLPVQGYTQANGRVVKGGCSRTKCLRPSDVIHRSENAEVCHLNNEEGPAYGNPINVDICTKLHRIWVEKVNYCLSNPFRAKRVIVDAPQCIKPFTTYVNHTETEGNYDECLLPGKAEKLQALAKRVGKPFGKIASMRSRVLCSLRDNQQFTQGICHDSNRPIDNTISHGTLMIGDSITYRGSNELHVLKPQWKIDGYPGRPIAELAPRIRDYLRGHTTPSVLVVALGTNLSAGYNQQAFESALNLVPDTTRIIFVTPYRQPNKTNVPGFVKGVNKNADMMRTIASQRPNSCVAEWADGVKKHPELLVDGTHATHDGEATWAKFIAANWDVCLQTPLVDPSDSENAQ